MAVLSVMAIEGDADDLIARMEATIDPVAARKAPQYGGISSTVVRTDNGIKIFNLWETEEGRQKMAGDPDVQAAVREAGFPAPAFKAHQVLAIRSAGETGKALSRRIFDEVWNRGNVDVIHEVIAPDFVGHNPTDGEIRGPDGFRQLVERYHSAFSNIDLRIDNLIAEGDTVATYWTARGTHTNELMGIAPTGREVTVEGIQLDRIRDGKIVESHGLFDALGMLQQLGAVPAATPAHA
jgi:steroid delta-isomerase-like uncharacterized protein